MRKNETLITALLLALPGLLHADAYDALSGHVAQAARRAGFTRLAVMPFHAVGGSATEGGMVMAERLVSRLAAEQDLEIVERTLLDQVLKEQGLGAHGVLRPEQAQAVGKVLGVEAIVAGTYLKLSHDKLEVHARLIDAKSARILGASTEKVRQEWQESWVPQEAVWNFDGEQERAEPSFAVPLVRLLPDPFRDAPKNIAACSNWERRVDDLQAATLELKARHWAAELRRPGFSPRGLTKNPGSEIRSQELKQAFYARLKFLHAKGGERGLLESERRRMEAADELADSLRQDCYQ